MSSACPCSRRRGWTMRHWPIPAQLHRRRGRSKAAYRGGGGQGHAVLVVTRLRGAASVTGAGGLSADGAGRSDGQRGEDDGAEPLTLGPGQAGHCWEDKRRWSGRAAGLGRPRKERKGGPVLRVERFHHFLSMLTNDFFNAQNMRRSK